MGDLFAFAFPKSYQSPKLDWQKNLWNQKQLSDGKWMLFVKCDIDLFHVEFRSIFDYVGKILCLVSDSPGEVRSGSFEKLRHWINKEPDKNIPKLGRDLAQLVLSCEWFSTLKEIRESIVHHGGDTLVFPEQGKILFQVYQGIDRKVLVPEIMFNENVVDFELYAGLYVGYLIAYLEQISEIVYSRISFKRFKSTTKSYHLGLQVIRDWIKQVLLFSP